MQTEHTNQPRPTRQKFVKVCTTITPRQRTQLQALARFNGVGASEMYRRIFDGFVRNERRRTRRELEALDRAISAEKE